MILRRIARPLLAPFLVPRQKMEYLEVIPRVIEIDLHNGAAVALVRNVSGHALLLMPFTQHSDGTLSASVSTRSEKSVLLPGHVTLVRYKFENVSQSRSLRLAAYFVAVPLPGQRKACRLVEKRVPFAAIGKHHGCDQQEQI